MIMGRCEVTTRFAPRMTNSSAPSTSILITSTHFVDAWQSALSKDSVTTSSMSLSTNGFTLSVF